MEGYHHRLRERFTNRITNFWGFMLFMLNESCIMYARKKKSIPEERRKDTSIKGKL
jgi:hypothetical protein